MAELETDVTAEAIDRARALLGNAARIVTLTGAGVSAESGVPTFRGAGGLWKEFRAEELATPQAFARDPRLVWEWYGWRRDIVRACAPNAAHVALAHAAADRAGFRIVTQNVDGLHGAAADAPQAQPIELHGSLFRTRCTRCESRWDDRGGVDASSRESLPKCSVCGALARPDIVWFGESLDPDVLGAAVDAATHADVCLVVGTSALVHPAAGLADLTRRAGGHVIEVNVADTPLTGSATIALRGSAATIVPHILPTRQKA
ncbi:MAG TPA: NAD-dependent deacylase [Gemmatimonadaceae bacterium]|nr:NAD-dependent deacylase [Gemmatimonadaceae bacterium]